MPLRSEYRLQREGITFDTIGRLAKQTVLQPALTLPLLLLARYTGKGGDITAQHPEALKWLRRFVALGLLHRAGEFLGNAVTNNWSNDTFDWQKEVVVVTGGSDGIGAIVVKLLAERGMKVAVMDIQPLTYHAPPTVSYHHTDLSLPSSIASACASIRDTVGLPTILINNAGIAHGATSIIGTPGPLLSKTFAINTLSHYYLAQALLPSMIARNHGMVITVASLAAYVTAPNMVAYASSKVAALAFHEGLAAEISSVYKSPNVRTVIVCQGYTRTKLFDGFDPGDKVLNYALEPETVAEEIVKAVLRGCSDHIVLPRAQWYMAAQMRTWPIWMQYHMRKGTVKLMQGFKGREVAQAKEEKAESSKEEAKGMEESMEVV